MFKNDSAFGKLERRAHALLRRRFSGLLSAESGRVKCWEEFNRFLEGLMETFRKENREFMKKTGANLNDYGYLI